MIIRNNSRKVFDELAKFRVKCSCGHTMIMINRKKDICSWCGKVVYRSEKDEFEDKLRKELKK